MSSDTDGVSYDIASFNRWNDERKVNVNRNAGDWDDHWWFGGVRHSFLSPSLSGWSFLF